MSHVLLLRTSPEALAFRSLGPPPVAPPLGLLSIAGALRSCCNADVSVQVRSLSVDVRDLLEVEDLVQRESPDVVGLGALTIDETRLFACARAVKKASPDIVVVAGGPHPTLSPERCLEEQAIDWVVVGEGERTMTELVDALDHGSDPRQVPGLAWREASGAGFSDPRPFIEDLDDLPGPAWDLVDLELYSRLFNFHDLPPLSPPYAPITTMRGCPYRCVYCHDIFGRRARMHTTARVVEDMKRLHDEHGVREFHIVDDIFNVDGKRLLAICDGIEEAGLDVRLAFPNGLRGDILTEHQLQRLRDVGCYSITFALETASPRLQKLIRKNLKVERVLESASTAASLGMITHCFVMLGFPTETREEMEHTIETVVRSDFDWPRLFTVCPFPGTEMFEMALRGGFDPSGLDGSSYDYDAAAVNASSLPTPEFRALLRSAEHRIFTHPPRVRRLARVMDLFGADDPYFQLGIWKKVRPLIPPPHLAGKLDGLSELVSSVPPDLEPCLIGVAGEANTGYRRDLWQGRRLASSLDEARESASLIPEPSRTRVTIGGPEPTMVKWLFDLVERLRSIGVAEVDVMTYGHMLTYPRYAEKLSASGAHVVSLLLHHPEASWHDEAVRVPGAFDLATEGLTNLAPGTRTALVAVAGPENRTRLADMARLARDLGASELRIALPAVNISPDHLPELESECLDALSVARDLGLRAGFDPHLSFTWVRPS